MALRGYSLERLKKMNPKERTQYFEKFAGYVSDSPDLCYAIRVGSLTLMSNDTWDLRKQFDKAIRYTRSQTHVT